MNQRFLVGTERDLHDMLATVGIVKRNSNNYGQILGDLTDKIIEGVRKFIHDVAPAYYVEVQCTNRAVYESRLILYIEHKADEPEVLYVLPYEDLPECSSYEAAWAYLFMYIFEMWMTGSSNDEKIDAYLELFRPSV